MWVDGLAVFSSKWHFCCLLVVTFACSTIADSSSSPTYPPLTLAMILRDFKAYDSFGGHPDFNQLSGSEKGITRQYLTFDKKPAYNLSHVSITTHGEDYFDKWFRDSPYCMEFKDQIVLNWNATTQKYVYYNDAFFPLDGRGWGYEGFDSYGKRHNFGFTAEFFTYFTYYGNETFTFSGDDDVWVYINNYRIIDLGGVHTQETQTVSLSNYATVASLKLGETYNFNFFFAERHVLNSVFRIETSVFLHNCPVTDACGVCNGTAQANLCTGVECGNGTCDCTSGCCKCANGWSQAVSCGACTSFCGNGIIEPGEQCDPSSTSTNAACCDKFCRFAESGSICRDTKGDVCKSSMCDGAGKCSNIYPNNTSCVPSDPSDCTKNLCDGKGNCGVPLDTGAICGDTGESCTQSVCSSDGTCVKVNLADGVACEGTYAVGECVRWSCYAGTCRTAPRPQGTACPSSNACTVGRCDLSGNCIEYENLTRCVPTDPCEVSPGKCSHTTGQCEFSTFVDGSVCAPKNRKDCATFSCLQGVCTAHSLCPASGCDSDPECDLNTGKCVSTPNPPACCGDGVKEFPEVCDDYGYGCCLAACNAWADEGVTCYDNNPCSNSTCDGFGRCVVHALPAGTPCGDSGNPCTKLICQASGTCAVVAQVNSTCGADGPCTTSKCNSDGICVESAKRDNVPCENATSICFSRVCVKGTCNSLHVGDGSLCGSDECGELVCSYGSCAPGTNYTVCQAIDDCHNAGICNPETGICSNPAKLDGVSCHVPSQSSCQIWTCSSGYCNESCPVSLPFCGNGIVEVGEDCDNSNNTCCANCKFLSNGSACASDNDKCTVDACDAYGVCKHSPGSCHSLASKLVVSSLHCFLIALLLCALWI